MTQSKFTKADQAALSALIKKIKGYYVDEEKTIYALNAKNEKVIKEHTVVRKYYPPDLSAIIFVLTNRSPGAWSQKPSANSLETETETQKLNLSELSENTLRELSELYDKAKNTD